MQSQMEAKLASLKSPGLKSGMPSSPTARNFTGGSGAGNRSSLVLDNSVNYLSPDSAALAPPSASKEDAAATLAQQRAKFKASNAAHRISAPVLPGGDNRGTWGPSSGSLSQVAEQNGPAQDSGSGTTSRPKSMEFAASPRAAAPAASNEQTINAAENSWASMVTTPLIPMFHKDANRPSHLDVANNNNNNKMSEWKNPNAVPGVPRMGDPTIHRRKGLNAGDSSGQGGGGGGGGVYDDNGNLIHGQQQHHQQRGFRNNNNNNNWGSGSSRSPVLSNTSSNRFEDGSMPNLNGLGMQMGGFGMGQMGSPGGMGMMPGLGGMNPISPFGVNMNMLSAMGLSPEAQLLAAQMAASGFGPQAWMGMQPNSAGIGGPGMGRGRNGPPSGRSPGIRSATSVGSSGGTPKAEEDVDPSVLMDVPAWLRSLRLHKYTPNFEGMQWQDMVVMDEAALEAKGVAALGARRKMMKTFELVRKKMGIEGGPPSLPPSATL